MVFAKSGEHVLGGPDDEHLVAIKWFRAGYPGGGSGGRQVFGLDADGDSGGGGGVCVCGLLS